MFKEININDLVISDLNVRKFKLTGLRELANNIKEVAGKLNNDGLVHALTVRKKGKKFEVVAGQRRLRAIQLLNDETEGGLIKNVKCMVISGSKDKDVLISLSENMFSQKMDPIDRHNAYSMLKEKGYTVAKIAQAFNTSAHMVNQSLALANLLDDVIAQYQNERINDPALQYMTTLSKDQQQTIVDYLNDEEVSLYNKNDINNILERRTIDAKYALFDLKNSGITVITDLFNENSFVTDYDLFMKKQRETISQMLEVDKQKEEITLFYDTNESFPGYDFDVYEDGKVGSSLDEEYCFEKHGFIINILSLESAGMLDIKKVVADQDQIFDLLVTKGDIKDPDEIQETNETDDNSNDIDASDDVECKDTDVSNVPTTNRQELTKSNQNYFTQWHHGITAGLVSSDIDYGSKLMLTMLLSKRAIKFEHNINKLELDDEQFKNSQIIQYAKDIVEKYKHFFSCQYGSRLGFDEIHEMVMEMSDDKIKEVMTAVAICSLDPNSKMIDFVANHLKIDTKDYWQADKGFVDNLSTNPALIAVGNELLDSDIEKSSFATLKMADKKVKLAEVLKADYVPKYMEFPMDKYHHINLDAQAQYF